MASSVPSHPQTLHFRDVGNGTSPCFFAFLRGGVWSKFFACLYCTVTNCEVAFNNQESIVPQGCFGAPHL